LSLTLSSSFSTSRDHGSQTLTDTEISGKPQTLPPRRVARTGWSAARKGISQLSPSGARPGRGVAAGLRAVADRRKWHLDEVRQRPMPTRRGEQRPVGCMDILSDRIHLSRERENSPAYDVAQPRFTLRREFLLTGRREWNPVMVMRLHEYSRNWRKA
jgi:hypothetical protein